MKTWVIEPHDSFIARDGRPFGLIAGVRAASLPFPFPSTTTGGVRTRAGLNGEGVFDTNKISEVKQHSVFGPLLVQLNDEGKVARWFVSAPADALLLDSTDSDRDKATIRRLVPQPLPANAATNLPDTSDKLLPLYLPKDNSGHYEKRKPHGYAPRFWNWDRFKEWLIDPRDSAPDIAIKDWGISGLPQDERSHVAIERDSQTSEEGKLFQTRGLEFTRHKQMPNSGAAKLDTATRLALAVATDATNIKTGVASLGGERRLVCWREFQAAGTSDIFNSQCPDEIVKSLIENKACRVVLLTPGYFFAGWKPKWMIEDRAGLLTSNLSIKLKAAAVSRPQVVSGWDFENQNPKPTRRLVPAGAVFFLKLRGNEDEIKNWVNAIWMRSVSDNEPSRRDGFGLAALGAWKEGKDES